MLPEAGLFSDCSVGKKNPNEQKILSSQSKIIILSPHFQFFSHVSEPKHPTVCSALISNIYLLAPVIIIRELQNNGSETATKNLFISWSKLNTILNMQSRHIFPYMQVWLKQVLLSLVSGNSENLQQYFLSCERFSVSGFSL